MLTISKPQKNGFDVFISNKNFKCAFITTHKQYSYGKINFVKRHNDSDEIYVLLKGNATILTSDDINQTFSKTVLSNHIAYNVKCGTWHHLAVSNDALIFVAESGAVSPENTDTADISKKEIYI